MKLTNKAIEFLKNNREVRYKLAIHLDCTIFWLEKMINLNETDNKLTLFSTVEWICEKSGLVMEDVIERAAKEPIGEHLED